MMFHLIAAYPSIFHLGETSVPYIFQFGALGVELFFIISGFVILMTIERTPSLGSFVLSRFSRLYPGFLACLALTLAVTVTMRMGSAGWPFTFGAVDVAANLTMAPVWLSAMPVDPSYWSLAVELAFYAGAAAAFYGLGMRTVEWPALAWLVASMWVGGGYAYLFVIGMALYRHVSRQSWWLTYALLVFAIVTSALLPNRAPAGVSGWQYGLIVLGFTMLTWLATTRPLLVLRAGLLPFLGDVSYPLYLLHQIIGYAALRWLLGFGFGRPTSIMVAMVAMVALAWVVHRTVEVPGRRWLRGWRRV